MGLCVSCGHELTGPYCANCGEKAPEPHDLDWRRHLLEELPRAIFELEGPLPRTLVSLLRRPGELAQAFAEGRRRPFVTPVRLFLLAFLVYELAGALVNGPRPRFDIYERSALLDPTGLLTRLLAVRGPGFWRNPALQEPLAERAKWLSEAGAFVIAIFVAMLQSLVFIRLRRRYLEHLALALNVTTLLLLCAGTGRMLVFALLRDGAPAVEGTVQTVLAVVVLPIYWFLSIRRFYRLRVGASLAAAAGMTIGTSIIASILNVVSLLILIVTA